LSRTIFIGDVHGCVRELSFLLNKVEPQPGDRLIFLGDLVDKGPDSLGVLNIARVMLASYPGSTVIFGNHEAKALELHEKSKPSKEPWADAATEADWDLIRAMPLLWRDPELNVVAVHGGFFPRFFRLHGPIDWEKIPTAGKRSGGKMVKRMRRFVFIRHVDAEGNLVKLGDETSETPHWSAGYDGSESFAFFGHDPQIAPSEALRAPWATGIDTGVVFGHKLTAAILEPGKAPSEAELVSVPAERRYAEPHPSAGRAEL
jgi:hypothetical protein